MAAARFNETGLMDEWIDEHVASGQLNNPFIHPSKNPIDL
jgi:hypothetical protein